MGNNGKVLDLFSWAPKSLQMVTAAMKLKDTLLLGRKAMTNNSQHRRSLGYTLLLLSHFSRVRLCVTSQMVT